MHVPRLPEGPRYARESAAKPLSASPPPRSAAFGPPTSTPPTTSKLLNALQLPVARRARRATAAASLWLWLWLWLSLGLSVCGLSFRPTLSLSLKCLGHGRLGRLESAPRRATSSCQEMDASLSSPSSVEPNPRHGLRAWLGWARALVGWPVCAHDARPTWPPCRFRVATAASAVSPSPAEARLVFPFPSLMSLPVAAPSSPASSPAPPSGRSSSCVSPYSRNLRHLFPAADSYRSREYRVRCSRAGRISSFRVAWSLAPLSSLAVCACMPPP